MGSNPAGNRYFHFEFFAPSPFRTAQRGQCKWNQAWPFTCSNSWFRPQIRLIIQSLVYLLPQYSFKYIQARMITMIFSRRYCMNAPTITKAKVCIIPKVWNKWKIWNIALFIIIMRKRQLNLEVGYLFPEWAIYWHPFLINVSLLQHIIFGISLNKCQREISKPYFLRLLWLNIVNPT